jgi:hypothetical protein
MDSQLGQVDMVRWQGRRLDAQTRAKARVLRLVLGLTALSAFSLMIGFYSGLPVPIGLLQAAFVALVILIGALGGWSLVEALHRRSEPGVIHRRR